MSNPISQLIDFKDKEWSKHSGSFQDALEEVIRYLLFLEIIKTRMNTFESEFKSLIETGTRGKGGRRKLTAKEQRQLERKRHLQSEVELEIESFYLFSKIYLDMTAHFCRVYF